MGGIKLACSSVRLENRLLQTWPERLFEREVGVMFFFGPGYGKRRASVRFGGGGLSKLRFGDARWKRGGGL